jgi:hypothetical protein
MRRDESDITKRVMTINVDVHPSRGRLRKRWMVCVKDDMKIKGARKHVVPTPHSGIRGR